MQSPRITEAAFSLLGGEDRHGMHALVRHAGEPHSQMPSGTVSVRPFFPVTLYRSGFPMSALRSFQRQ